MDKDDLFPRQKMPTSMAFGLLAGLKTAAEEMAAEPQSPFAVPVDEMLLHLKGLVAHEFKMHQWYTYFAEVLRGENRGGLVELFEELAPAELADAQYFLRRIGSLAPQGVQLPTVPAPPAINDFAKIVETMLVEEQRAVLLLQHLRNVCGQDPMGFTVEGMMGEEQSHADRLQQFMPAASPKAKIAAAVETIRNAQKGEGKAVPVTAQSAMLADQQATLEQVTAENAELKQRLLETSTMAAQHAEAAETATVASQDAQGQVAEMQGMADEAMQQAMMAQQQAAGEADKKMRVAIRVQQIRQQLADIVSQDPVAEEGADVPAIATPAQQGMGDPNMDPAMQDPAMAQGAPAAAPGQAPAKPAPAAAAQPKAAPPPKAEKPAEKQAADLSKSKGLRRVGQLLTGSRAKVLHDAAEHGRTRSNRLYNHAADNFEALGKKLRTRSDGVPDVEVAAQLAEGRRRNRIADRAADLGLQRKSELRTEKSNVAVARTLTSGAALGTAGSVAQHLKEKQAAAIGGASGRIGQLLSGSAVPKLKQHAELLHGERKIWRNAAANEVKKNNPVGAEKLRGIASEVGRRGVDARKAVKTEQRKVLGTRVGAGSLLAATGGAMLGGKEPPPTPEKVAGLGSGLKRLGELATGSKLRQLEKEQSGHAADFLHYANAAKNTGKQSPRQGPLKKLIEESAGKAEEAGKAVDKERHARTSAAKTTGLAAGTVGLVAAAHSKDKKDYRSKKAEETFNWSDRLELLRRRRGGQDSRAAEKVRAARDSHADRDKEAGMKDGIARILRGLGRHVADGASSAKGVKELEGKAKKGLGALGAVTAGSAAVSTGTAIHQGNKTRRAIEENSHGQ